jgi:glycosyltransferase involved in cell wall biosynthesis
VGYLQVGAAEHGICRYGRLLAAEGRRRGDLAVREERVVLVGRRIADHRALRDAARRLSGVDLVHLQVSVWSAGSWGTGLSALRNLRTFRRHCPVPIVVTLHDANALRFYPRSTATKWLSQIPLELAKGLVRPGVRLVKQLGKRRLSRQQLFQDLWALEVPYPWFVAHEASRMASAVFVLTRPETQVLESGASENKTVLIPHFVEEAPVTLSSAGREAGEKTVVVAGFLTRSKGHSLILEAMRLLPEVRIVFVGGPSVDARNSEYEGGLMETAERAGVQDRLEVTGYLPDDEYYRRLAEADLAVCAFYNEKSASGSLASLIATGTPILASDVPVIAEYNAIVEKAIPTFSPNTAEELAAAIRNTLATSREELTRPLGELRERLSLSSIYERHMHVYRRVIRSHCIVRKAGR